MAFYELNWRRAEPDDVFRYYGNVLRTGPLSERNVGRIWADTFWGLKRKAKKVARKLQKLEALPIMEKHGTLIFEV